MKAVIPEIPPYRYEGHIKNLGAQYMRGICDYNDAFDKNVWITYSCNKEDIWISKIAGITSDNIDKSILLCLRSGAALKEMEIFMEGC